MATAARVHESRHHISTWDDGAWIFSTPRIHDEVQFLLNLMRRTGSTVEDIRELIEVPADVESTLRVYCRENPEEALGIFRVLTFRKRVAEEFERQLVK